MGSILQRDKSRTTRIYLSVPLATSTQVELDTRNRHYLLNVLRLKPGVELLVFNGEGGEYQAWLQGSKKKAQLDIGQHIPHDNESPLKIHLIQGISKGERMDYSIQKAVELGVSSITPVYTTRSAVKLSQERSEKKHEHWRNIAISACEQSGRCRLPQLYNACTLEHYLAQTRAHGSAYIFATDGEHDFKTALSQDGEKRFYILIGPEGGLDETEFRAAETAGFYRARLGPRVLRTETAGPTVVALLQFIRGDLGGTQQE